MNSLSELNSHGDTVVEFQDDRPADVIFDRVTPTNVTYTSYEGSSHPAQVGIEIIEIINYQTSAPVYKIDVSSLALATVTWTGLPEYMTVSNPSTGVYQVSGIRNFLDWDLVKNATINMPNNFVGNWTYTSTITYNTNQTKSWTVTETVLDTSSLQQPTNLSYVPSIAVSNGANTTRIVDNGTIVGTIWTITCTPSLPSYISSMTAPGTAGIGGSTSFNGTTKVLTITGTDVQVNNRLSTMTVTVVSGCDLSMSLTYVSNNATTGESDSITQTMSSSRLDYLGVVRANDTYQLNTPTTIEGGPYITDAAFDGTGTYQYEVTAVPTAAVSSMSVTSSTKIVDTLTPGSDEAFGRGVLLNSDATTMAINGLYPGAINTRYETDRGFIDVFVKDNGNWVKQARIRSNNISTEGTFASFGAAAISGDGNRILASDSLNSTQGPQAGAVFTFVRTGTTWTQESAVYSPEQPDDYDAFGPLVADRDLTIMAIGSRFDEYATDREGSVFIYTRSGSTWTFRQKLTAPTPVIRGLYGSNMAMSPDGNWLAVVDNPIIANGGAADLDRTYIYKRNGNVFNYYQTITFTGQTLNDNVVSLSFSNTGRLAIGTAIALVAPNPSKFQIRMYQTLGGDFGLTQTITINPDASGVAPNATLRLSDDDRILYVGEYTYDDFTGRVTVYRRSTTNWTFIGTVGTGRNPVGIDPPADGLYGGVISINTGADIIAIGSSGFTSQQDGNNDGRVYVVSNALSVLASYSAGSATMIIFGTRDQVNHMMEGFNLTPSTGYSSNFELYYRVVTPASQISTKNQTINKV